MVTDGVNCCIFCFAACEIPYDIRNFRFEMEGIH